MDYKPLEVGEQFLSVSLFSGQIKIAAFKNKNKTKPQEPDYVGNGIAVWVSKKQEPTPARDVP